MAVNVFDKWIQAVERERTNNMLKILKLFLAVSYCEAKPVETANDTKNS